MGFLNYTTWENDIVLTSVHMAVDQVLMGVYHRRRDACMCLILAIWISFNLFLFVVEKRSKLLDYRTLTHKRMVLA